MCLTSFSFKAFRIVSKYLPQSIKKKFNCLPLQRLYNIERDFDNDINLPIDNMMENFKSYNQAIFIK